MDFPESTNHQRAKIVVGDRDRRVPGSPNNITKTANPRHKFQQIHRHLAQEPRLWPIPIRNPIHHGHNQHLQDQIANPRHIHPKIQTSGSPPARNQQEAHPNRNLTHNNKP